MTLEELDKLAAEKVMGWALTNKEELIKVDHWSKNGIIQYICQHEIKVGDHKHRFWQPSRNISQAWECLEKFEQWVIYPMSCYIYIGHLDVVNGRGDNPSEAIVKACLRAKGVEV